MAQLQLPIFPATVTQITSTLAFENRDGRVTYYNGLVPVFAHAVDDLQTFRMITSQFCANGNCTQPEIVRAFGVPLSTVKRYCAVYQKKGPAGFYAPRVSRGPAVLTAAVLETAQQLLDQGVPVADVAQQLGIKQDTFKKAVRAKRVHAPKKKTLDTDKYKEPTQRRRQSGGDGDGRHRRVGTRHGEPWNDDREAGAV